MRLLIVVCVLSAALCVLGAPAATVQPSVAYGVPLDLGTDPTPNLTTRGLYGHSTASAAETLQFQQQLLAQLGANQGVQLADPAVFSAHPGIQAQLQQQLAQQQAYLTQRNAANPYIAQAQGQVAQATTPVVQQQQIQQQPIQYQQQQQFQQLQQQLPLQYQAQYGAAINNPQNFAGINQGINYGGQIQQQQQFIQPQFQQPQQQQLVQQQAAALPVQQFQQPNVMVQQQQQQLPPWAQQLQGAGQLQQQQPQQLQLTGFAAPSSTNALALPAFDASTLAAMANVASTIMPSASAASTGTAAAAAESSTPMSTSSAGAHPSGLTPSGPRPTSCGDSDYKCQFTMGCYSCYNDTSLSYCPNCLKLLNCGSDKMCQMTAAKAVCQSLAQVPGTPSLAACKLLSGPLP